MPRCTMGGAEQKPVRRGGSETRMCDLLLRAEMVDKVNGLCESQTAAVNS